MQRVRRRGAGVSGASLPELRQDGEADKRQDVIMSETEIIGVPSMALNYTDGKLESIGIAGEMYCRERGMTAKRIGSYDKHRAVDDVDYPAHYTGEIECIDAMIQTQGKTAVRDFCACNAFKYLWRWRHKGRTTDLMKAGWYIEKAVDLLADGA